LSSDVPLSGIVLGSNVIPSVGAQPTVMESVAVPPAPPSVEVTLPVVLT
jgi:hypothetical protein